MLFPLLVLMLAQAQTAPSPSPSPSSSPAAIATAAPGLIGVPSNTKGLVIPPAPAVAPAFVPATPGPPLARPPGGIAGTDGPFVGLSVDDAIAMALARNTDLAVSQANRRIAAFAIVAAKGAYDLNFQLMPQYELSKQPSVSTFQSGPGGSPVQQITEGATGGFAGNTKSGGRYQITTTAQRIDSNATLNSYEPYYQTALALQFTQPLARGLAIDANRRQLELARINGDLSDDNALVSASSTIDNVLNAYYNLVAAWRNVAIQEDALRQAKAQSDSNGRLVRQGQSAPVDVVESNTQVDTFQDDVYSAIANVASLQNTLKGLILSDPADPAWTANLVPTSPISYLPTEPTVADLVATALRTRPEVSQLRENIREENVNVKYAKDQTKPQIDLNFNIIENGFAGQPTNPNTNPIAAVIGSQIAAINDLIARSNADNPTLVPLLPISGNGLNVPLYPGTVGKLGASYGTALQGKFPTYSITATIGFPLQNRAAKGNYGAELERRRSLATQELALIQRVQVESRNAVQQYRSARSRLVAAAAARAAAEQVAASEIRKFRVGASTTFLVLQRQVTVANARGRELQAQSDVQKALVELDRVGGTILAKNNVSLPSLGTGSEGPVPALVLSH